VIIWRLFEHVLSDLLGISSSCMEEWRPGNFVARGRVCRPAEVASGKREVIVYDYVDRAVPVLARMAAKREKGYKALGYVLES
jgi:hypothetical protein